MKHHKTIVVLFFLLLVCLFPALFWVQVSKTYAPVGKMGSEAELRRGPAQADAAYDAVGEAGFVGSASCAECHAKETELWRGSHHDLAMDHATPETVLGDFGDVTFEYYGETSRFYTKGGRFLVNTPGPDGTPRDFEVLYTFGVYPLQQYLVELEGGRLQALRICWDARPAEEGGQRWYHLYPGEHVHHKDPLHWTKMYQNWNHMCAECHSTNLRKNFDLAASAFSTAWSEIDVACEACHGPATGHVAWAEKYRAAAGAEPEDDFGLAVQLKDRSGGEWIMNDATGIAERSAPPENRVLEETCARCHARRSLLSESYRHSDPLLNTHRLALIEDPLYYPDGQIRDEVYEFGSFLQSKMHQAGVRCVDCHDPHSLRLKLPGEMVCTQCHLQTKYATPEHHHHDAGGAGASCIACHMPTTTYMGVDARHDHSFRVPRPDLSLELGVPNACTKCHADQTDAWAQENIEAWHGPKDEGPPHFAHTFAAAWKGDPRVAGQLAQAALDEDLPEIIRASALGPMTGIYSEETIPAMVAAVRSASPLLRLAGVEALGVAPPQERLAVLLPLLKDGVLAVRVTAARHLLDIPLEMVPQEDRPKLDAVAAEYMASENANAERASSHLNLGVYHLGRGDAAKAEEEYKTALRLEPDFVQTYVNLADLYRGLSRDSEGAALLKEALARYPDVPILNHAYGLALTRLGKTSEAVEQFRIASETGVEDPTFGYVYAIALHSTGSTEEALRVLDANIARHPFHYDSHIARVSIHRDLGNTGKAAEFARKMLEYWPDDQGVQGLLSGQAR